jgi:hypothetical protein
MLRILGHASAACDGITRRDLLRAGALSALGALAAPAVAAPPASPGSSPSKSPRSAPRNRCSVILIDLFGGPSHLDMFDPKPAAPAEVRGEFGSIATVLPGIRVCEHLPRLARLLHRTCLIRTVSHGYNSHNPYAVMTGYAGGSDRENYYAKPTDHPSIPSVAQYLGVGRRRDLPGYVMLPAFPGYSQGLRRAGPYGGYLGSQYDPLFSTCNPRWDRPNVGAAGFYDHALVPWGDPRLPELASGLTLDALDRRRTLLQQLERQRSRLSATARLTRQQEKVFELLLSPRAQRAFDLTREPPGMRERYGRDLFGSSVLLARRLVEAGVTFVTVHTEAKGNGHWDTHSNNFRMLKHYHLPFLDRAVSALVEDLELRGLLETTLVVVTGDMGRTPRVNRSAGRDHWPQCGFCLLAGGGTRAGLVYGTSDKQGAYPTDSPVSPGDLAATIYHQIGVDPEATVPDQTGRPVHIAHGGRVLRRVLVA